MYIKHTTNYGLAIFTAVLSTLARVHINIMYYSVYVSKHNSYVNELCTQSLIT